MCEPGSRPTLTRCLIFKLTCSHLKKKKINYMYILKWVLYVRNYLTFQNWWCALCGGLCQPRSTSALLLLMRLPRLLPVWSGLNSGFCFPRFFVLDGCCESSQRNPPVYQKNLKEKRKKLARERLKWWFGPLPTEPCSGLFMVLKKTYQPQDFVIVERKRLQHSF